MKFGRFIIFSTIFLIYLSNLFSAPVVINLPANDGTNKYYNDPNYNGGIGTDPTAAYQIEITGTYSANKDKNPNCDGVDGGYIYINGLIFHIDTTAYGIPFDVDVTIPIPLSNTYSYWVGIADTIKKSLTVNPVSGEILFISESFFGLRINNKPINNVGYQPLTHRYNVLVKGTGSPFTFNILDYIKFRGGTGGSSEEFLWDDHKNNCGELTVKITKIINSKDSINVGIGDIFVQKDLIGDEVTVGVKISILDSSNTGSSSKNILDSISGDNIVIIDNGKIYCCSDSTCCAYTIICNEKVKNGVSFGFVVDNSNSMNETVSNVDTTKRIDALKKALGNFINNLGTNDEAFLLSFSTYLNLDKDWTNDKDSLKAALDAIKPIAWTSVYDAIDSGQKKMKEAVKGNKALIVLSDGVRTSGSYCAEIDLLKKANTENIPIYIVALSYTQEDKLGRDTLKSIADTSLNGRLFDINSAKGLDSIYNKLREDLTTSEDCYVVYYLKDTCKPGTERWVRIIYTPNDTTIITKVVKYKCPDSTTTGIKFNSNDVNSLPIPIRNINVIPNPADMTSQLTFDTDINGDISISLYDIKGNELMNINKNFQYQGHIEATINSSNIPSGSYYVVISLDNHAAAKKIVIQH